MPATTGMPVICDFGSSVIGEPGQKHRGDVMPDFYRAPEVILGMEWDEKIDIWCVGLMLWDLFQGNRLFFALKDRVLDDEQHLAEMVALMGPPPKAFLERSEKCRQYWDSEEGEDHRLFIALAQKIFRWLPEERPSAQDLTEDEFIAQPQLQRQTKQ
ncbi:hypothetical protein N0V84_011307 [Fusarium piperis]|uniref:Protein kinase domain-containing protein n=1 Tax=Fusarium piperis TaxID=1435070 RepID=A0A9W8TAP6_9HYPO|nr:hypothetical protein N0V84_011307 [Fusarium piperis]